MKVLVILFLALLAGCGRPSQVRAVTTLVLVQPEWGGIGGTGPVDAQALKFCQTVGATATSPLYARRVLRARPALDASVSQIEARLGPGTVLIEVVVTANDRAAALEASQVLADAMVKLTSDVSEEKYHVRLRLLDRPKIVAQR